jgi:26S proteasome regulatory subunit N5
MVVYLALSQWDNEVSDMMHRLKSDARLEAVPAFRALVTQLTTNEVVPWPLPGPFGDAIRAHAAFKLPPPAGPAAGADVGRIAAAASAARSSAAASGALASQIVRKEDEERSSWAPILHKRVLQHNLRVVAKCYQRVRHEEALCLPLPLFSPSLLTPRPAVQVSLQRLAAILAVDAPTAEAVLSELVAEKAVWARIDRPAGVVTFSAPRPAPDVLREWSSDIGSVLDLVNTTAHLINKEYLIAANKPAPLPAAAAGVAGIAV